MYTSILKLLGILLLALKCEMEPKQVERLIRIEGGRGRGQPAGIYTSTYIYIQSLIC